MTKDEERWVDQILQLGCIVCRLNGVFSPAEVHHLLDGNRRIGHKASIPLCAPHHRGGGDGVAVPFVSRHPYKKRFEDAYGPEADLLEQTRALRLERFGD